jgi:hypothetical protein
MATRKFNRDSRQLRVADALHRLVGPGPAAFFRDACRLTAEPSLFEATSHQVGHLIREIESSLRAVLKTVAPAASASTSAHEKTIRVILQALEIASDDPVALAWLRTAPGEDGLHSRAHRDSLESPRPVDDEFKAFWEDIQGIFDEVLKRFEKHFLEVHKTIDTIVAKGNPTADDVSFLKNNIPNNLVAREYLFERLPGPQWLELLAKDGFFADPPAADRDATAGTISFPPWPPGRYLARMAKMPEVGQLVLDVSLGVAATDNIRVHETLAEVALALPVALSKGLVPKVKEWLGHRQLGLLFQQLADVVVVLAAGGEPAEAIDLASDLFAILPGERQRPVGRKDVRGRVEEHQYKRLLERCRPALARAGGTETVELFCTLLDSALEQSEGTGEDYSWMWRPAIEEHSQNHHESVPSALVSAVRDCVRESVERDPSLAPAIVQKLEGRGRLIYRRLALDVLAQHPERHVALIEERLQDKARFDDSGERHEYARLAAGAFPHVSEAVRSTLLSWIEAASETESTVARWTAEQGAPPSREDAERLRRIWQRDRLAPLKDVLPPDWRTRYESLVAVEGEPEHPNFPSYYTRSWVGPTSPTSAGDLASMTVEQIVEHLRTWKASSDRMSPTPEGLGRQLAAAVALEPERFAAAAPSFSGLDPTYVRSLLSGLRDGLKAGRTFDWTPVIELASWATLQPRSASDGDLPDRERDPHWGWARKTIADLFLTGFQSKTGTIPFASRDAVWKVLAALAEDPDPRPEDEAKYGGSNMDPGMMSINTTRGEAMHAVVNYALWVRRNQPQAGPSDFGDMPEVRSLLDDRLDTSRDPSTTVRAVYGWYFPFLCYLDRAWVADRMFRIFPPQPEHRHLRDPAWETYLGFNGPGADTWPLLEAEYRRAVDDLKGGRQSPARMSLGGDPIVQHVMVLYWHGQQALGSGSLLDQFFEVASEELRHQALDFIGRSLENDRDEISEEIIERMKVLWQVRLRIGMADPVTHAKELSAFAWWTKAARLDLDWRLDQLLDVLRTVGPVDPGFVAVEMLAEAAATRPRKAVACLAAMVSAETNEWEPTMWSTEARTLLMHALASGDTDSANAARDLINVLEARGHRGYRDLLVDRAA